MNGIDALFFLTMTSLFYGMKLKKNSISNAFMEYIYELLFSYLL